MDKLSKKKANCSKKGDITMIDIENKFTAHVKYWE